MKLGCSPKSLDKTQQKPDYGCMLAPTYSSTQPSLACSASASPALRMDTHPRRWWRPLPATNASRLFPVASLRDCRRRNPRSSDRRLVLALVGGGLRDVSSSVESPALRTEDSAPRSSAVGSASCACRGIPPFRQGPPPRACHRQVPRLVLVGGVQLTDASFSRSSAAGRCCVIVGGVHALPTDISSPRSAAAAAPLLPTALRPLRLAHLLRGERKERGRDYVVQSKL